MWTRNKQGSGVRQSGGNLWALRFIEAQLHLYSLLSPSDISIHPPTKTSVNNYN